MLRNVYLTAAILPLSCFAISTHAATLVSNLSQPAIGGAGVTTTQWLASNFASGPNALGYQVDSVTIDILAGSGTGFFAAIYSDSGFAPDTPIVNGLLSGSPSPGSGLSTYTTSSAFLAASTNYWLVLGVSPGGNYSGNATIEISGVDTSAFGFAIGDFLEFTVAPGGPWAFAVGSLHFQVNGTAVPEPSSGLLFALGLLVLATARTRPQRYCIRA